MLTRSRTNRRLRLSLGPQQVHRLLMALSYARDTFYDESEPDGIRQEGERTVREWAALSDVIRREKARQGR